MRAFRQWRVIVATLAIVAALAVTGGAAVIYAGAYDVAATAPHWPLTERLLEAVRLRSIKRHAAAIDVPPNLADRDTLLIGTDHFAAHCAVCHGAPGVPKGDIAHGLNPPAPNLAVTARLYGDAELFWIVKHGIKMTGMPAWSDHSDAEIWATVAFLNRLKAGMSEQEYGELVKANMMRTMPHGPGGMHSHDPAALPQQRPQ